MCPSVLIAEEQASLSIFMPIYAVKLKLILRLKYRHDIKNLGGSAGTLLFVSTAMSSAGPVLIFPSNLTACLAKGPLPIVLVDIYFCLEMFKELFGGR